MKKIPELTIKHSKDMTKRDLGSHNKRGEKMRAQWMQFGQTQEQVDTMFPVLTLEKLQSEPGYYGKFAGKMGGDWRGPFTTESEAQDVVGEIAFESTFS